MEALKQKISEQKLKELVVPIEEILHTEKGFYAHTPRKEDNGLVSEKAPELLEEHTDKCLHYFLQLYRQKNLGIIFENFRQALLPDASEQEAELFWKMLVNLFIFHDFGKCSPVFQESRMGRKLKFEDKKKAQELKANLPGSRHSVISAAFYIDYFSNQICQYIDTKEKQKRFQVLLLANSYIITHHHVDLGRFEDFLNDFYGGKLHEIFKGMENGLFCELYKGMFYQGTPQLSAEQVMQRKNNACINGFYEPFNKELPLYTYIRFFYSVLIACDYYATSEYESGVRIQDFGTVEEKNNLVELYEQTERLQKIRAFNPREYIDNGELNVLRNCIFYEAEQSLEENKVADIYFIEAPTGSGKSNIALNCSFKLLSEQVKKIFYVYPFNTLVEQSFDTLQKIYKNSKILEEIAVVNSITPVKVKGRAGQYFKEHFQDKEDADDSTLFYQQALLDRQFLNYPMILTTHVSLFETMFGCEKEAAGSFYQLAGSIVVLDEIQSYKNEIWTEIMMFLQCYSRLLNMKIIIMSATLPRLDYLTGNSKNVVPLIKNRSQFFCDKRFKDRVSISFELLHSDRKTEAEELFSHIVSHAGSGKKILVEFIRKASAEEFYHRMKEMECSAFTVLCMTGDDNQLDRSRIISRICEENEQGVILIATQVVEAGVDIDMDIGYKDISILDSDEQFLGRINRNYQRNGTVFFFDLDSTKFIYGADFRSNQEFTLRQVEMQTIFEKKDFPAYYEKIMEVLKKNRNESFGEKGIQQFVTNLVRRPDFKGVHERMRLIEDDNWDISVFLARVLKKDDGTELNGKDLWNEYKELLCDRQMDYAERKVKLKNIRGEMSYFIYRIKKTSALMYSDRIGELYLIENTEKYFENGRLNKKLFEQEGALFLEI